jgi:hypothetical protein
MHKAFRAFVILPCVALALSALTLHAAAVKSETFAIPFEFHVQKQIMPAGEYRVQQATGSDIAILVNTRTGKRVEILRPANTHEEGKTKLVFKGAENQRYLTHIF